MTLLGDAHAGGFDAYAPAHFADMMLGWSTRIEAYLQTQKGL